MSMHEISRHIMTWLWTSVIAKDRQLHISATQIKLNHGSCTCGILWIAYCDYGGTWWLVVWWAKNPHDWWRYMWLLQFNASQTEKWQSSKRENRQYIPIPNSRITLSQLHQSSNPAAPINFKGVAKYRSTVRVLWRVKKQENELKVQGLITLDMRGDVFSFEFYKDIRYWLVLLAAGDYHFIIIRGPIQSRSRKAHNGYHLWSPYKYAKWG